MVSVSRTAAPLVKHCCIPEINSYSQISSSSPLHRNVPLLKLQPFPDEWETSSINSCLALLLNRKWYKKMFIQYQIILHSHIIAPHYWQAKKKKEIWNISGWVGELNLAWLPNTSGLSQIFQVWGLIKTSLWKILGWFPCTSVPTRAKYRKMQKITIYMWSRIGSTPAPSLASSSSQKVMHIYPLTTEVNSGPWK